MKSSLLVFFIFSSFSTIFCGNIFQNGSTNKSFQKLVQGKKTEPVISEKKTIRISQKNLFSHPLLNQDFALTTTNPIQSSSKKITLTTRDGLVRNGILVTRPNARGNIVMCHPAAYDKYFMTPYAEKTFSYYNCLYFDFRRHGENSKKQCSTLGKKEIYEVEAAVNLFKQDKKIKNLPIFGFGVSLGAATLIEAESKKHQFDALILQSPFESLRKQVSRTFPFFGLPLMHNLIFGEPMRLYSKIKYRVRSFSVHPDHSIRFIRTPIFLMHAHNDPVIVFDAYKKLKKAGNKCIVKTWSPVFGRHTELFKTYPDLYTKKCNEFLNNVISLKKQAMDPMMSYRATFATAQLSPIKIGSLKI